MSNSIKPWYRASFAIRPVVCVCWAIVRVFVGGAASMQFEPVDSRSLSLLLCALGLCPYHCCRCVLSVRRHFARRLIVSLWCALRCDGDGDGARSARSTATQLEVARGKQTRTTQEGDNTDNTTQTDKGEIYTCKGTNWGAKRMEGGSRRTEKENFELSRLSV